MICQEDFILLLVRSEKDTSISRSCRDTYFPGFSCFGWDKIVGVATSIVSMNFHLERPQIWFSGCSFVFSFYWKWKFLSIERVWKHEFQSSSKTFQHKTSVYLGSDLNAWKNVFVVFWRKFEILEILSLQIKLVSTFWNVLEIQNDSKLIWVEPLKEWLILNITEAIIQFKRVYKSHALIIT